MLGCRKPRRLGGDLIKRTFDLQRRVVQTIVRRNASYVADRNARPDGLIMDSAQSTPRVPARVGLPRRLPRFFPEGIESGLSLQYC